MQRKDERLIIKINRMMMKMIKERMKILLGSSANSVGTK